MNRLKYLDIDFGDFIIAFMFFTAFVMIIFELSNVKQQAKLSKNTCLKQVEYKSKATAYDEIKQCLIIPPTRHKGTVLGSNDYACVMQAMSRAEHRLIDSEECGAN